MQKGYFTPIKNMYSQQKKTTNSDFSQRQGDWVCLNCQNLNYSFRKMCNRCKSQSRQENQSRSVYSYYYYSKLQNSLPQAYLINKPIQNGNGSFSNFSDGSNVNQFCIQNKQNNSLQINQCMETPKKKRPVIISQSSKLDGLPSVSPLIKKYQQKQHHTTLSKFKNCKLMQSQEKDQFDHIKVRDFDKLIQQFNINDCSIQNSPTKQFFQDQDNSNQQQIIMMKQLQQSISKIII